MKGKRLASQKYPFRVFISHKVSAHGGAAIKIKHTLENYAPEKLKIFVSPALSPGVKWQPEVLEEIESADLFVLLYLVEGMEMDWCLYEVGYFEREALKTGRNLICVTNPNRFPPGPLVNRQRLEATEIDIEKLLRAIFADKEKPVRRDLLDRNHKADLDQIIRSILTALQPVTRQPLCPRLWITVNNSQQAEQIKNGTIPMDVYLAGESDAMRELGLAAGDKITVEDFYARSESKGALNNYLPHVANCLRRIIEEKVDLWVIPPVRLAQNRQPKVLVPAYIDKGSDNYCRLEFLVYQPQPDYDPDSDSDFGALWNLLFLSWAFRRQIIEEWLETFLNLQSRGPGTTSTDIHRNVQKCKLVFQAIVLDALNRDLDSPRRVKRFFDRKEDRDKLEMILNQKDGLYMTYAAQLTEGMEANDLNKVIKSLQQLKNINKTMLVMTTARLHEIATEKSGDLV